MRAHTLFIAGALLMPLSYTYADPNSPSADDSNRLTMKEHVAKWMLSDEKFVEKAALSNMAEVELSKVALEKAQSPQVRDFAKQMIKDHTAASTELKSIAQSKNLAVPADLDREHQEKLTDLRGLSGADFDAKYLGTMEKDHEKAVTLFTAAAADQKLDKQLQQFAAKTLPILRGHSDHVQALDSKGVSAR